MHADDIVHYGDRTFRQALERVQPGDWDVPGAVGTWSIGDIVRHLASFEVLLAEVLEAFPAPPTGATARRFIELGGGRFNDREVDGRAGTAVGVVLAEYDAALARARDLLAAVPLERRREPGFLPWYGAAYDLEDFVAYQYYGHKREHSAQIVGQLDRLRANENATERDAGKGPPSRPR